MGSQKGKRMTEFYSDYSLSSQNLLNLIEQMKFDSYHDFISGKVHNSMSISRELLIFLDDIKQELDSCRESFIDAKEIGLSSEDQIYMVHSDNTTIDDMFFSVTDDSFYTVYRSIIRNKEKVSNFYHRVTKHYGSLLKKISLHKILDESIDPTAEYFTRTGVFVIDFPHKKILQMFNVDYESLDDSFVLYISGEQETLYKSCDIKGPKEDYKRFTNIIEVNIDDLNLLDDLDTIIQISSEKYLRNGLIKSVPYDFRVLRNNF